MLIGGSLMLPAPGRSVRLSTGLVQVIDGHIASVTETDAIDSADLGGDDLLICPGFIDAHLHLPQFDSIGVDGLELLDWLDRVIFPAEARWADTDYAGEMTRRVLDLLAAAGTTAFAAYATVHHDAARQAIDIIAARGIRAIVGQVLMDRNAPADLLRPCAQLIKEAASLMPQGRVEPAVTPRFAVSCSDELLRASGGLASKTNWPVQTHLAETRPECALIAELFEGLTYTEVYERSGLLGPRSILAHGIWLNDADRARIHHAGSLIAHCPTANLFLQSGRHDRIAALDSGLPACLGSDVAGGPDRSMPRVARAMIETAKNRAAAPPTAAEAWWQITQGNADSLNWSQTGRLEANTEADILLVRPDIRWRDAVDPLGALLYAWDDRWLQTTLIAGCVAYTGQSS